MGSQASVSSSASTVPLDLIHDQDNDFVDEIEEVDRIYLVPSRFGPACSGPSRSGPKLNVDSAPFEIKYFWTEIHKCLSFQNVFDRFEFQKFKH